MRIIGGERRGKKLLALEAAGIRPTSDRAREAIFNIVAHQSWLPVALPQGARVLDLACGTGAFAAEALSRGAGTAVLHDNHAPALKLATQNIAALGWQDRVRIEFADLAQLPKAPVPFDLVFCDPPYGQGLAAAALAQLAGKGYLHGKTLLVVETAAGEALAIPPELRLFDQRRYGAAMVWFMGIRE